MLCPLTYLSEKVCLAGFECARMCSSDSGKVTRLSGTLMAITLSQAVAKTTAQRKKTVHVPFDISSRNKQESCHKTTDPKRHSHKRHRHHRLQAPGDRNHYQDHRQYELSQSQAPNEPSQHQHHKVWHQRSSKRCVSLLAIQLWRDTSERIQSHQREPVAQDSPATGVREKSKSGQMLNSEK